MSTETPPSPPVDPKPAHRDVETAAANSTEPQLIPVLGPEWALGWEHLAVTAAFAVLFVFLNHLPLRGTDLWGHLQWGEQIITDRSLPTDDPLQPLAAGMHIVDLSWLSQVAYAAAQRAGGPEALIGLFTLLVWSTYLLIARTCFLQTKHALFSTIVTGAALFIGWSRISTIRPENFALLLFTVLLWLLFSRRVRREDSVLADDTRGNWKLWLGIPCIFALWANLHGSFLCGLALLGCFWSGRVIEVLWAERNLKAVFADPEARRLLYWCELAAAAALVNPYTIDAYIETFRFSANANLRDILEWAPLSLTGIGGPEFAAACLTLGFLLRLSRRRFAPSDVLLLLLFGIAGALQLRMIGWFAAVWAVVAAPHLWDVVGRWFAPNESETAAEAAVDGEVSDTTPAIAEGHSYRYTLGCIGLIWIAFAFSTFSRPLLGGLPRTPERVFGDQSPLKLTAWLRQNPPQGQVFNPQHWGDWLAWTAVKPMELFATTNIHLIPRMVWQDYGRVTGVTSGWETTLDRYRVQMVIVDRTRQAMLARALKSSPDWVSAYEDEQAQVFRRRPAKLQSPTQPAAPTSPACTH